MAMTVNAQVTAIQTTKFTDGIYAGIGGGIASPLDMNSLTPFNAIAGVKLGKEITPAFALEVEGGVLFNDNHFADLKNVVKVSNVGLNGKLNLCTLFNGYQGRRNAFEISTNTGLGWTHYYNTSANDMTAKTGIDIAFNLGKQRAWAIVASPAIYWNLTGGDNKLQFNKHHAQLALTASVVYYFKHNKSNGTHGFRQYDITAMTNEIARLQNELEKKPKEVVVEKVIQVPAAAATNAVATADAKADTYVFFAKNSAELSQTARQTLMKINAAQVSIKATASPEGTAEYNKELSQKRADAVKNFLETATTVKVLSAEGLGVTGEDSGRVAIIIVE